MKAALYDQAGKKTSDIELPTVFETPIREDIIWKVFETEKTAHPYAPYKEAGKHHSASGTISHQRHDWKGHYGKGISRVPRKTMWRRGTQFNWVGAEVAQTRGGRRAHPPTLATFETKINKKERMFALAGAIAATAQGKYLASRYAVPITKVNPIILESLPKKTKELRTAFKTIWGDDLDRVFKTKTVRAGKGKRRGRKYKTNAGALLVVASTESTRMKGIDMKSYKELSVADLYPLGRVTIYTKKALEEMKQ